jgi:SAM-dependent methyltransferase
MDYTVAAQCRCCGSDHLTPVLDLGCQPLANSYTREPVDLPVYPLVLNVCNRCYHNQLSVVVDPDCMFREYLYVSGTSRTLREHFAGLAREAMDWAGPQARRVLDIACNDGTLLDAFRSQGCAVQGVDPAGNLVALAREKGLPVTEGYWPQIRDQVGGRFDILTACNVLAHVADPAAFLTAALDVVTDDGTMVIEVPYCREMILHCEWDTIYHEHLSYFLLGPLMRLVEGRDAAIVRVRRVPIHGGSLRMAVKRGPPAHCQEALELERLEKDAGLQHLAGYEGFARQVETNCNDLRRMATGLTSNGKKVIAYGASAKGNTLLNRCPLPLAYIVDDNPLKHGYLTPGCQIPICHPREAVPEAPGLHVLLLAWNFAREIVQNWRRLRPGKNDRVVHYVPKVLCHAVDADLPLLE